MEARLKLQLMSLLPRPVAEESLSDLARLVGRTWAESRSAGEARRSEMMSLKAKIESDTKKLLRAEEVDLPYRQRFAHLQMAEIKELALLKSERQAQGRLVTEELAMARAENKPRLLNLLEDLKHGRSISAPNTPSVQAADQALQAAEQEKQELQAMLQQLEKDKATLIQEQEDMIRRVRERVDPLQDRVAQQSRGHQNLELASRLHVLVQSTALEGMDDEGTALSLTRVQALLSRHADMNVCLV
eukprot:symbB.v1.2.005423.t2/scaffold316.1/size230253/38